MTTEGVVFVQEHTMRIKGNKSHCCMILAVHDCFVITLSKFHFRHSIELQQ